MKVSVLLRVSAMLAMSLPAVSSASLLGPADPYNVFFLDHMNSRNSDTEGRVAVGGEVNLNNYSIGLRSPDAEYSYVTGGLGGSEAKFWSGSILNGGVYGGGNVRIDNAGVIDGNVVANGTANLTNTTTTGGVTSNAGVASPVDFVSAFDQLSATSTYLAGMDNNGITDVKSWGSIFFHGSDELNIFSITSQQLANSVGMHFDLAADSTAIINVSGSYNDFSGFGFIDVLTGQALAKEIGQNILFNFFETNTLDVNSIGVIGSILAPHASLYFNNGQINGTVVAQSMDGSGQFNYNPFTYGESVARQSFRQVPEPHSLALLGLGGLLLLGMRKRQQA